MTENSKIEECVRDATPCDGRQSQAAAEIGRGTVRLLTGLGYSCIAELPLPNGQRADITALSATGRIVIVEVKSCLNDFRTDQKWEGYLDYCDELYFSVNTEFPIDVLPGDTGLIIADRYGAEMVRHAPETPLNAARRKTVTLRFARAAALRLSLSLDPALPLSTIGAQN